MRYVIIVLSVILMIGLVFITADSYAEIDWILQENSCSGYRISRRAVQDAARARSERLRTYEAQLELEYDESELAELQENSRDTGFMNGQENILAEESAGEGLLDETVMVDAATGSPESVYEDFIGDEGLEGRDDGIGRITGVSEGQGDLPPTDDTGDDIDTGVPHTRIPTTEGKGVSQKLDNFN